MEDRGKKKNPQKRVKSWLDLQKCQSANNHNRLQDSGCRGVITLPCAASRAHTRRSEGNNKDCVPHVQVVTRHCAALPPGVTVHQQAARRGRKHERCDKPGLLSGLRSSIDKRGEHLETDADAPTRICRRRGRARRGSCVAHVDGRAKTLRRNVCSCAGKHTCSDISLCVFCSFLSPFFFSPPPIGDRSLRPPLPTETYNWRRSQ